MTINLTEFLFLSTKKSSQFMYKFKIENNFEHCYLKNSLIIINKTITGRRCRCDLDSSEQWSTEKD